jgi:hypothetical protein
VLVDLDVWAGDIYAGGLPQLCVFTGEPTRGVHSVRYSSFPRWVYALLFAGILPFFAGVLLTRRTVTGKLPMSAKALRRFVVQRAAGVVIVVVGRWVRLRGVNPTFAVAVRRLYAGRMPQWQIGTVPTSFANYPLPEGYGPPQSLPSWIPPPWNAAFPVAGGAGPPQPPPTR